jgi:hypothetical protein
VAVAAIWGLRYQQQQALMSASVLQAVVLGAVAKTNNASIFLSLKNAQFCSVTNTVDAVQHCTCGGPAGDARWDIRMAAWLLYVKQLAAKQGSLPLWSAYLALLPQERDMCCLLNYNRQEAAELQLPGLVVSSNGCWLSLSVALLVVLVGCPCREQLLVCLQVWEAAGSAQGSLPLWSAYLSAAGARHVLPAQLQHAGRSRAAAARACGEQLWLLVALVGCLCWLVVLVGCPCRKQLLVCLKYVKQLAAKQGSLPLWSAYLSLLPQERDMCCLLNYNRQEAAELQLPRLMVSSCGCWLALPVVLVGCPCWLHLLQMQQLLECLQVCEAACSKAGQLAAMERLPCAAAAGR